jgi:DNA repair exonuclease SbcCD ATPase subunit
MILFKKIKFKNFLSTGNQFNEIEFDKSNTTLIVGTNGAGKSTVLDALTFSLFGKSFRGINKPQLINSTNEKDCLVEIDFSIGTIDWKVRRGIKPTVFEIHKNGEVLNQEASSIDQQKWLEQNVLKMNYKSFTQVVILGSSNFVPFMQLTAASRREVIEDLLDIKIFSSMTSIVKDKIRFLKEQVRNLDLKKESLSDKIEMQENFIEDIEKRGKESIKDKEDKIDELCDEETSLGEEVKNLGSEIEDLNKKLESYKGAKEKLRKLGNLKGKMTQKVATITEEHSFFKENSVCPTCTQDLEEEFRLNKISEAKSKAKELQNAYKELEQAIRDEEIREDHFLQISKDVSNLTNGISKNNSRITSIHRQIRDLQNEIQRTAEDLANRSVEHDKLAKFREDLQSLTEDFYKQKENITYYDYIYSLLKDGGVKTKIIKKYLPLINQQVNKYLQMMDFYINFTLDEEFNETIQTPIHEDFSYSSFSEGEKQRIDLALLFTWREVAKFKNSTSTNLLILDEVFDSSLDGYGTDEFLKIIRFVIKDANVFVISHKTGLEDKFQSVIRFEKVKGFSRMIL